jgi:hypothetical protein
MSDMTKRVTVILSDEEYAHVRKCAGLVPLSRWFKSLAIPVEPLTVEKIRGHLKKVREVALTPEQAVEAMAVALIPPLYGDPSKTETYYHTATSHRMTCLCVSCVAYRSNNDIPLGGFK